MRVRVPDPPVAVRMRMRFAHRTIMPVSMMVVIMAVAVFMLQRVMNVLMRVPFHQMRP